MRVSITTTFLFLLSSSTISPALASSLLRIHLPSSHAAVLASSSFSTSAVLQSSPPIREPLQRWGGFVFDIGSALNSSQENSPGAEKEDDEEQTFLLDVISKQYVFAPMLVSVDKKTGDVVGVWEVRRGELWGTNGEGMRVVEVRTTEEYGVGEKKEKTNLKEITARVMGMREFYEKRAGFSPMSILKNPMILLALVAMVFMFGMPYLLENMDPETRAEFEAAQKQGGLSSIMGSGPSASSPSSSGAAASNPRGGGGSGGTNDRDEAVRNAQNAMANFDLAGWMAGQQTKMSEGGKSSGSDVKGGGARRRG